MTVTPYNNGSYLVTSRSRDEIEHLVDLTTGECSCEAALDFKTTSPDHPCAHIEAAIAYRAGVTITRHEGGNPFAIFSCAHEA